jgi:hypothetical protein
MFEVKNSFRKKTFQKEKEKGNFFSLFERFFISSSNIQPTAAAALIGRREWSQGIVKL